MQPFYLSLVSTMASIIGVFLAGGLTDDLPDCAVSRSNSSSTSMFRIAMSTTDEGQGSHQTKSKVLLD